MRARRHLSLRRSLNPTPVHPSPPPARARTGPLATPLTATLALVLASALFAACAPKPPVTTAPQLLAPPADPCVLAREDAALNPRLDVERVPTPVKMDPAPIKTPVPRTVIRASRGTSIQAEVKVDTLGKPDMATFTMLETPHTYYTTNLKAAVAKWTFEPALRNGCKVARFYKFTVNLGPRPR